MYQSLASERSPRTTARPENSPREHHLSSRFSQVRGGKYEFPQPVGSRPLKKTAEHGVKFLDNGSDISPIAKQLKEHGPRPKKTIELDPVCLSCTAMQSDIIKRFKIACLAYAPSPVVFRNIQFSRSQILVFRKFLMGQCSKIAHLKEPYKSLGMSTKRIFDDMYLFLKEANMKNLASSLDKGDSLNTIIDEMNGLPVQTY